MIQQPKGGLMSDSLSCESEQPSCSCGIFVNMVTKRLIVRMGTSRRVAQPRVNEVALQELLEDNEKIPDVEGFVFPAHLLPAMHDIIRAIPKPRPVVRIGIIG